MTDVEEIALVVLRHLAEGHKENLKQILEQTDDAASALSAEFLAEFAKLARQMANDSCLLADLAEREYEQKCN